MRYILASILLFSFVSLHSQIYVDEVFDDWTENLLILSDPIDDVPEGQIDFSDLWISNDDSFLFLSFETGLEINLQNSNDMVIYIDYDNNLNTGQLVNGIGADLIYSFGEREGFFEIDGFNYFIFHNDIDFISMPTVSGNRFEIMIKRTGEIGGATYEFGTDIKLFLEDTRFGGDIMPDESGSLTYTFDSDITYQNPGYSLKKENEDLIRILSFNSLFDGLFIPGQEDPQKRIIKGLDPDIIGFQEIYNHDADDVAGIIEGILPLSNGGNWYRSKISPDIILLSKYPITGVWPIDGNGAFRLELGGQEMLLIVAHLACCENDGTRQRESDQIISFIRRAKDGSAGFTLKDQSPIVLMGDLNLVGDNRQQNTLKTGDINNENTYGPDHKPDWDNTDFEDIRMYNTGIPAAATWFNDFSSFGPGRLDYMFFTNSVMENVNAFSLYSLSMTSEELSELNILQSDSGAASDHLAIVGDFRLDVTSIPSEVEKQNNEFLIYPNPSNGQFTIELEEGLGNETDVNIYDSFGKHFFAGKMLRGEKSVDINLSPHHPGMYLIELIINGKISRKQIIVQ